MSSKKIPLTVGTRNSKVWLMWKPRNRKLFMFAIPFRRKIKGSVLYQANEARGAYSRAEDVFVVDWASDCKMKFEKGEHYLIDDGFEAEPTDLDMWEQYKDDPEFSRVAKLVEETEGKVKTMLIHEDSLIAKVED